MLVLRFARKVGGHTDVVTLSAPLHVHSVVGRVVVIVIAVLLLGLVVLIGWKSMGALRRLPREELSGRQRMVVLAFCGSEVLVTALGVLVGYVVAQNGHKGSGMVVGAIVGAFAWVAMCWILGGAVRLRRARHPAGSSTAK